MVNFGLNPASILGIFLAVAGAGLYFLRSVRPELSRDHDIFFAAVGLLCGFILLFQGWRLDPILQFGQLLLSGSAIFFAVESIRLRGVATEQAKRNTRIVDEERPVSPVYEYQAELDELEPLYEERPTINPRRRIQGTKETRPARTTDYEDQPRRSIDEYDDEPRRRYSNRGGNSERLAPAADKPTKRRRPSRPTSRPGEERSSDEWGYSKQSESSWEDAGSSSANRQSRSSRSSDSSWEDKDASNTVPRSRKRRSSQDSRKRGTDIEATPTDYVDYKPIDPSDSNFDEP
ncbi:Ycf66 family protein [Gloeocapsopsis crepidinum LEGE 06123]|uniref:Ycf66 family protein n=1 Tax=Gloeocapsopsis crepidinum LEGE 06123 TaxID=588587 RepID=A0ABR9UVH6_9CHRO|nr:Ycf66 family protein [Gloeocapsopsis crepidinum]MBE9192299.1 Ycf66 family protein [Gloeocapsopsis crepidinum LEGE 06123]